MQLCLTWCRQRHGHTPEAQLCRATKCPQHLTAEVGLLSANTWTRGIININRDPGMENEPSGGRAHGGSRPWQGLTQHLLPIDQMFVQHSIDVRHYVQSVLNINARKSPALNSELVHLTFPVLLSYNLTSFGNVLDCCKNILCALCHE